MHTDSPTDSDTFPPVLPTTCSMVAGGRACPVSPSHGQGFSRLRCWGPQTDGGRGGSHPACSGHGVVVARGWRSLGSLSPAQTCRVPCPLQSSLLSSGLAASPGSGAAMLPKGTQRSSRVTAGATSRLTVCTVLTRPPGPLTPKPWRRYLPRDELPSFADTRLLGLQPACESDPGHLAPGCGDTGRGPRTVPGRPLTL